MKYDELENCGCTKTIEAWMKYYQLEINFGFTTRNFYDERDALVDVYMVTFEFHKYYWYPKPVASSGLGPVFFF